MFTEQALFSIVILGLSALLQASAGFGAALFGLPLLLWAGNTLVESQLLILSAMLPQNLFAGWRLRHSIDFREVLVPAAIRITTMPIGVAGLAMLMTLSKESIGQFVGILILAAIGVQCITGVRWSNARRWYWMLITFGGSGLLQGLMGTGGPPMVLWVYGQQYSVDRARAFLFAIYTICFLPQLCLLYWNFGGIVWLPMMTAIIAIPVVLLGADLGLRISQRLGDFRIRTLTYLALVVLAIVAILEPWINS